MTALPRVAMLAVLIAALGWTANARAHFTEKFEAGTTGALEDLCWQFEGAALSDVESLLGNYSVRTSPLGTKRVLKGPWVNLDGFGALTWRHRVDGLAGAPTLRVIRVSRQGARLTLATVAYGDMDNNIGSVTLAQRGVYRFEFEFTGGSAAARGYIDNVAFPAEPFADVTTNDGNGACESFGCLVEEDCVDFPGRPVCVAATKTCVECVIDNHCGTDDECADYSCSGNLCSVEPLCDATLPGEDAGDDGSAADATVLDAALDATADSSSGDGALPDAAALADSGSHDAAADASADGGRSKPVVRARGGGCAVAFDAGFHPAETLAMLFAFAVLPKRRRR